MNLQYPIQLFRSLRREYRTKKHERSPLWPAYRKRFLNLHPNCAACGSFVFLQVHHIKPFHLYPKEELDEKNLITLCMSPPSCHLYIGHGGDWEAFNPFVERYASLVFANPDQRERLLKESAEGRKVIKA